MIDSKPLLDVSLQLLLHSELMRRLSSLIFSEVISLFWSTELEHMPLFHNVALNDHFFCRMISIVIDQFYKDKSH